MTVDSSAGTEMATTAIEEDDDGSLLVPSEEEDERHERMGQNRPLKKRRLSDQKNVSTVATKDDDKASVSKGDNKDDKRAQTQQTKASFSKKVAHVSDDEEEQEEEEDAEPRQTQRQCEQPKQEPKREQEEGQHLASPSSAETTDPQRQLLMTFPILAFDAGRPVSAAARALYSAQRDSSSSRPHRQEEVVGPASAVGSAAGVRVGRPGYDDDDKTRRLLAYLTKKRRRVVVHRPSSSPRADVPAAFPELPSIAANTAPAPQRRKKQSTQHMMQIRHQRGTAAVVGRSEHADVLEAALALASLSPAGKV